MTALAVSLPVRPESVREARHFLDRLAPDVSPDLLDSLRLLVSELVTNGVRHAGLTSSDRIHLEVRLLPGTVRVEVRDPGPGFEPPQTIPSRTQTSGWGLYLVRQIADRWGVDRNGETRVWFEIENSNSRVTEA